MNNQQNRYPYPNVFFPHVPVCYCFHMFQPGHWDMEYPQVGGRYERHPDDAYQVESETDHGNEPYVLNIREAALRNRNFRTAIWTGEHFQVTLMSIAPGEDIGLEIHPDVDQFLRIEQGHGLVQMGEKRNRLDLERYVHSGDAIIVPAGTWHNLTNTGHTPLKLYSIYAPPEHPFGTVHETKLDAMEDEDHRHPRR